MESSTYTFTGLRYCRKRTHACTRVPIGIRAPEFLDDVKLGASSPLHVQILAEMRECMESRDVSSCRRDGLSLRVPVREEPTLMFPWTNVFGIRKLLLHVTSDARHATTLGNLLFKETRNI